MCFAACIVTAPRLVWMGQSRKSFQVLLVHLLCRSDTKTILLLPANTSVSLAFFPRCQLESTLVVVTSEKSTGGIPINFRTALSARPRLSRISSTLDGNNCNLCLQKVYSPGKDSQEYCFTSMLLLRTNISVWF